MGKHLPSKSLCIPKHSYANMSGSMVLDLENDAYFLKGSLLSNSYSGFFTFLLHLRK